MAGMFFAICLFIFKESGTFFPKDFFEPIRNFSFSLNDRARPKRELCPAYVIISYLKEMIPADTSPLLVCAKPSLYLARSLDFAWVSSFLTGQSISSFSGATTLPRAIPRRTVCAFGLHVITPNRKQQAHRRPGQRGWSTGQEPNPQAQCGNYFSPDPITGSVFAWGLSPQKE